MNNVYEKDWAEDNWGGYSGMSNDSDWCIVNNKVDNKPVTITDDDKVATENGTADPKQSLQPETAI